MYLTIFSIHSGVEKLYDYGHGSLSKVGRTYRRPWYRTDGDVIGKCATYSQAAGGGSVAWACECDGCDGRLAKPVSKSVNMRQDQR